VFGTRRATRSEPPRLNAKCFRNLFERRARGRWGDHRFATTSRCRRSIASPRPSVCRWPTCSA